MAAGGCYGVAGVDVTSEWTLYDAGDTATWPGYGRLVVAYNADGFCLAIAGRGTLHKQSALIRRSLQSPVWWAPIPNLPDGVEAP